MTNTLLFNAHLPGDAFALEGSGSAAALLFHGFTATPNEVLGLGRALQQAGYSAFGPLLAGHGTHPRDLNRVRWQDWTAAAEQAFDDLSTRFRRVIVGGESNGGLLALYLAAVRPQAAAVLAYAPALVIPMRPYERLMLRVLAPLGIMFPKGDLDGNSTWQGYRVNPLHGVAQILQFQAAVREKLPQVKQPALIVQGRRDTTIDPRGAEAVYNSLGSARKELRWLDDGPHCLLLAEQRQQVYDMTLKFVKGLGD